VAPTDRGELVVERILKLLQEGNSAQDCGCSQSAQNNLEQVQPTWESCKRGNVQVERGRRQSVRTGNSEQYDAGVSVGWPD